MSAHTLALVQQALSLAVFLMLPVLAAGLLASVASGLLQNFTAWRDPTLSQAPKLLAVCAGWAISAPWIADELTRFARLAWGG